MIVSLPPQMSSSSMSCRVLKIPALLRLTTMLVQAEVKKPSPVKLAWI